MDQRWLGRPMPAAYLEFIRLFGHSSGDVTLHERLDFSMATVIDGFNRLDSPIGDLMPIAFDTKTEAETVLCLDLATPALYDDPSLYGMVSVQDQKTFDLCWDEHFSHWIGRQLFISALVKPSKYAVSVQPTLSATYELWAHSNQVPELVDATLLGMGFVALVPECGAYHMDKAHFVAYQRYPERSGFFLRIGSGDPSLSRNLRTALRLLSGTEFTERSL